MDNPLNLARLHATGVMPVSASRREVDALHALARAAGRRIVEVSTADGRVAVVAGWLHDSPLEVEERGGPFGASDGATLVMAACVRLCWPDPDKPLLPGTVTSTAEIKAVLAPLGVHNVTASMNRLIGWGFLRMDPATGEVCLGPEIGLWRTEDVALLRREYHVLPSAAEPA